MGKLEKKVNIECAQSFSHVRLFSAPWNVACQAPLSIEFSRQEYWSGVPFPTPGDLPDPGSNPHLSPPLHWPEVPLSLVPPNTYIESIPGLFL